MIENFDNYVTYLNHWIKAQDNNGFGLRKKLADHLGVQTSYISQVLSAVVVLKEDYALVLNEFLRHDYIESDYFITMVAIERASSHALKLYYKNKARELKTQLKQIVNSAEASVKIIDNESQYEEFYSSWIYATAHALSAIGGINSEVLKNLLNISDPTATKVINCLRDMGLVIKDGTLFKHSGQGLHLPKDHKWVNRHHTNWKIKTLEVLQRDQADDFHYTSVASLSIREAEIIKELMRTTIRDIRMHIAKAKDENVYCYSLDFYPIIRAP